MKGRLIQVGLAMIVLLLSINSYANQTTDEIKSIMKAQKSMVQYQVGLGEKQLTPPKLPADDQLNPIKKLMKTHELVFFFSSTCPHCQKFDPVFKRFLQAYPFKHMDFSFDGKTLPGFKDAMLPRPALIQKFFPGGHVSFPTVFLVNTKTLITYVVSMGEKTYPQFLSRMEKLAPDVIRFDKGIADKKAQQMGQGTRGEIR